MEISKGTKEVSPITNIWDSLFEMEAVAGIDGAIRAAALCIHCKCSHGCSGLVQDAVGAQFWSAYVPATVTEKTNSIRETLEQIDVMKRTVSANANSFEIARTANDIARLNDDGKFASLIGIEGAHTINNSLGVLRMVYELGARYMTLTPEDTMDRESKTRQNSHDGLAPFAEELVREMNKLGMLVDISQLPEETMKQVLRVSKAPLVASNWSGSGRSEPGRKMSSDLLALIKKNGGVVMVDFYSAFLTPDGTRVGKDLFEAARELRKKHAGAQEYRAALNQWKQKHPAPSGSAHQVVDQIDEVVKGAGIDHVGIGTDANGIGEQDTSLYPNITQELRQRGYAKGDIQKVLGHNLLRALEKAEEVARG